MRQTLISLQTTGLCCTAMSATAQNDTTSNPPKHTINLPENLYHINILTDQPYILFMTREKGKKYYKNKGTYGAININTGQTVWTKDVNYGRTQAYLCRFGVLQAFYNGISDHVTTHLYNAATGLDRYKIPTMPVYWNNESDRMVGYKNPTTSKLSCYCLSTGKSLWTTELPHHNNETWNNIRRTDSIHIIFTANNLCRLNLATGSMDYYEAKTAVADTKTGFLQGIAAAHSGHRGCHGAYQGKRNHLVDIKRAR